MKRKNSLPGILKITKIDGFLIYCLFDTGEARVIDFKKVLENWKPRAGQIGFELYDFEQFKQVIVLGDTLAWPQILISFPDFENPEKMREAPLDLDPIVLYEHSVPPSSFASR